MKMFKIVEETIEKIKHQYNKHEITGHLESLKEMLENQCRKLFLKNVKPIETQEDYDRLIDVFKKLAATMEKIITSGRDFAAINKFAEVIRENIETREKCYAARDELHLVEKNAITNFIGGLSDIFSKKYQKAN